MDTIFQGLKLQPPAQGDVEAGGYEPLWINVPQASGAMLPMRLSDRVVVFDNKMSPWGDHGPLWGLRGYDVFDRLENLQLWRVGDWTKGREGHAVYLNVSGDLLIRNLSGIQCGAQLLQIVWRKAESRWQQPTLKNTIRLSKLLAFNCGMINSGMAVRASWPVSIFNTGAGISIDNVTVVTNLPPFVGDRNETFRSHGALMVGPSEREPYRTPWLHVVGLKSRLNLPDRDEVRIDSVDSAILTGLDMIRNDGAPPRVTIVDDCGEVFIGEVRAPLEVCIRDKTRPFNMPTLVKRLKMGEDWTWRN